MFIERSGSKVRYTRTLLWRRVRVRDEEKCVRKRLYNQMRVTQHPSGSETFDPFLDELSCSFSLSGSLEGLHVSRFRLLSPLCYTRSKIDASETRTRATELGLVRCLVLGVRLYLGNVCV